MSTLLCCLLLVAGCDEVRAVKTLERSLQQKNPESSVHVSVHRTVLQIRFDPFPASVRNASDQMGAMKDIASDAFADFTDKSDIDSVEVSGVNLGVRLPPLSATREMSILFPTSFLRTSVSKRR